MKRGCLFLLAFLLWTAVGLYAQPVVLVNESFDNATCSFSAYRGGWNLDSNYHVSGKYAYLGFVPTQPGDSVELVSNWFDCENYSHVLLQFSQICKISYPDNLTTLSPYLSGDLISSLYVRFSSRLSPSKSLSAAGNRFS